MSKYILLLALILGCTSPRAATNDERCQAWSKFLGRVERRMEFKQTELAYGRDEFDHRVIELEQQFLRKVHGNLSEEYRRVCFI